MNGIDRHHWNLARVFYAISSIYAVIGIISNSIIFLITVKTKNLRSTYNLLIGLCAIADILHQLGVLVKTPMVFDIYLEIESDLCIALMFFPQLGVGIGCISILCVGLDRLISVAFPIQYRNRNRTFIGFSIVFLMFAYFTFECCLMIYFRRPQMVVCDILSPYPDQGVSFFLGGMVVINMCTVIIYLITWINLRKKATIVSSMGRIYRSLFIIMLFDVIGWFLTPSLIVFLRLLHLHDQQIFAFTYLITIFTNFSLASKLSIYYSTSSEYKTAIKKCPVQLFHNGISTTTSVDTGKNSH